MLNFHFSNAASALSNAEDHIKKITSGDLRQSIDENSNIKTLTQIATMQNALADIFGTIMGATSSMNTSSDELGNIAKTMRDTAKQIAEHTNEVDTSTSEMEKNLSATARETEQVNKAMANITTNAYQSAENLHSVTSSSDEMTSTITEIAENAERARNVASQAATAVLNATERVTTLGQAAEEVNKVIGVISEISDQTKLLALNATIEAARAGEAGKGFAVVANEVKTLASQTSTATGDISQKVQAIHTATQATIEEISTIEQVIEDVNNVVATIAAAVEEQSVTSQDISENINNVATGITEMTESVSNASQAIAEVSQSISQSSELANNVSELAHTMNAASQGLRKNSTKVYATSLEVAALGKDIDHVTSTIKLSQATQQRNLRKPGLISFSQAYSVGIDGIDTEHKKIMDYINTIHKYVKDDAPLDNIAKALTELAEFTVGHFALEERYFDQYNYPETASHKKAHSALLDSVGNVLEQVANGDDVNFIEVLIFLKDWLQVHILKIDKKYSSFLKEQGLH